MALKDTWLRRQAVRSPNWRALDAKYFPSVAVFPPESHLGVLSRAKFYWVCSRIEAGASLFICLFFGAQAILRRPIFKNAAIGLTSPAAIIT
jgi:hypothetical protein